MNEVFQPKTAEELIEQMRRWEAGELDSHDIAVLQWKAGVFLSAAKRTTELEHKLRKLTSEKKALERQRREEAELIHIPGRGTVRWGLIS